jgi:pilus assembly protein CpaE
MSIADVAVVTGDQRTLTTIQSAMTSRCKQSSAAGYRNLAELKTRLSKPGTNGDISVVVVDIDRDSGRTLLDLSEVTAVHPKTRFIVVSTDCSEELILQAMQAGARHFLRKQNIAVELDTALERLLTHEPQTAVRLGDVISVFSCSGGCGATTVAVNLANELRLLCSEAVLIMDLDQHYGTVASHLGLAGSYGVARILSRPDAIDAHLIQTGAVRFTEGLDVLLSPVVASEDMAMPVQWENLPTAVEASRQSYRYVVIDAPRLSQQLAAGLAMLSHTVIIVFQLTVRDIAFAKSTITFLRNQGVASARILPLANRVRRRRPLLQLREGEAAIGMKLLYSLRSDWRKAIKSMNRGLPLAGMAPRSRLRRDFYRLARTIHRGT